ncbi:hypothetical protein BJ508DRAFT_414810 [Ascobolus immersus RN42]|uniref:Uncharacterized protein n=1 Tax=Ascobolus immersus RN42 TaxID=1160509 RepID=A0A3N4II90_ASCIM|nr:hypothetical protein BJ508DRAFT_414810 [Ascobolus immersus RN42]
MKEPREDCTRAPECPALPRMGRRRTNSVFYLESEPVSEDEATPEPAPVCAADCRVQAFDSKTLSSGIHLGGSEMGPEAALELSQCTSESSPPQPGAAHPPATPYLSPVDSPKNSESKTGYFEHLENMDDMVAMNLESPGVSTGSSVSSLENARSSSFAMIKGQMVLLQDQGATA